MLLEYAADNKLRDELFLPERKPVLRRVFLRRDCVLFAFDIASLARFGGPLDQLGEDVVDWWAGESQHIVRRQAIDKRHDAVENGHCATCLRTVFRSAIRGRFDERAGTANSATAGAPGPLRCIAAVDTALLPSRSIPGS